MCLYWFLQNGGAHPIISAIDMIDAHVLPYFAQDASTGSSPTNIFKDCLSVSLVLVILFTARNAWPFVQKDVDWFAGNGQGKKIYLSQVIMVYLNQ